MSIMKNCEKNKKTKNKTKNEPTLYTLPTLFLFYLYFFLFGVVISFAGNRHVAIEIYHFLGLAKHLQLRNGLKIENSFVNVLT